MTLVAVSRINNKISFSSDSRISFGGDIYFDKGIKIFNVSLRIRGTPKTIEEFDKYEFEYDYGLAVVGSSINAYTIKDSIVEILPNIQYLTNLSNFSIYAIGDLVLDVYRKVSQDLTSIMRESGLCEIILGGYCIFSQRIRILRFFHLKTDNEILYKYEEILDKEGIVFLGSGKKLAEEIKESQPTLEPLQIIKKVINSKRIKAVGGALQYGGFYDNNFKVSGVIEQYYNEDGQQQKSVKYRRGFIVEDEIKNALKPPYLFIKYGYMPVKLSENE